MRTRLAALVSPLLLCLAPPSAGQEAAALRLTLEEALARARARSARLAQLSALGEAAEAAERGARAARRPLLEASAGYSRNSDVPELVIVQPGLGARTIFPNIPDVFRTRLGLGVPLHTGGRLQAGLTAAREQALAARLDTEAAGHDLALETTAACWSLVTARETARVLGVALAAFAAHERDAENRLAVGLAARHEALAVRVERERAELARLQAEDAAATASEDLARLLDLPPGTTVETVEPAPPAAEPGPVAGLVEAALRGRPELRALAARRLAAQARMGAAAAERRPQVAAQAAYDWANPNPRILPLAAGWRDTWSVGVSVSLNVLDGGRAAAAVAEARARARALEHQEEDLRRRVRLEVTTRALRLGTARRAVETAARAVDSARENARVLADRYQEGVASSSERLDGEVALLRAELDATDARARLGLAAAELLRALGQ
jgi:outer membrane protein TolC